MLSAEHDSSDDLPVVYHTSSDIDGDFEDTVVRTTRRIRVEFAGYIDVEVIEPPEVFDAEIKQSVKRDLIHSIVNRKLGVPVGYEIRVTA